MASRLDNEPGASAERAGSKLAMAKSQQRQPPEHERMQGVSSSALEMGQRDMRLREYRDVLESFAEQVWRAWAPFSLRDLSERVSKSTGLCVCVCVLASR